MKSHFAFGALAVTAAMASGSAQAQESSYNWSGAYAGAYISSTTLQTRAFDVTMEEYSESDGWMSLEDSAVALGVMAGYNYQRGNWVMGPELDLNFASTGHTKVDHEDNGLTSELGFNGSITGRVGYATGRSLFFARGGAAWAKLRNAGGEFDGVGVEGTNGKWGYDGDEAGFFDGTRTGYVLGMGLEHALTDQIRLRAEYSYTNFGEARYGGTDGMTDEPFEFKNELRQIKLGLTYAF